MLSFFPNMHYEIYAVTCKNFNCASVNNWFFFGRGNEFQEWTVSKSVMFAMKM